MAGGYVMYPMIILTLIIWFMICMRIFILYRGTNYKLYIIEKSFTQLGSKLNKRGLFGDILFNINNLYICLS